MKVADLLETHTYPPDVEVGAKYEDKDFEFNQEEMDKIDEKDVIEDSKRYMEFLRKNQKQKQTVEDDEDEGNPYFQENDENVTIDYGKPPEIDVNDLPLEEENEFEAQARRGLSWGFSWD